MTTAEGEKLAQVKVDAEKNLIASISSDFEIASGEGVDR